MEPATAEDGYGIFVACVKSGEVRYAPSAMVPRISCVSTVGVELAWNPAGSGSSISAQAEVASTAMPTTPVVSAARAERMPFEVQRACRARRCDLSGPGSRSVHTRQMFALPLQNPGAAPGEVVIQLVRAGGRSSRSAATIVSIAHEKRAHGSTPLDFRSAFEFHRP